MQQVGDTPDKVGFIIEVIHAFALLPPDFAGLHRSGACLVSSPSMRWEIQACSVVPSRTQNIFTALLNCGVTRTWLWAVLFEVLNVMCIPLLSAWHLVTLYQVTTSCLAVLGGYSPISNSVNFRAWLTAWSTPESSGDLRPLPLHGISITPLSFNSLLLHWMQPSFQSADGDSGTVAQLLLPRQPWRVGAAVRAA